MKESDYRLTQIHKSTLLGFYCSCSFYVVGASEVCRQCMDSGAKFGQRKKTKEIIAWAKKKRKHIRREELLAFLLDKPYPDSTSSTTTGSDRLDDFIEVTPHSHQKQHPPPPSYIQGPCSVGFSSPISSPRRRALLRDEPPTWSGDGDVYTVSSNNSRESTGRKRTASTSGNNIFDFNLLGPDCKRMRF